MKQAIENLIHYAIKNDVITARDTIYVRNQIYHLVRCELTEPFLQPQDITMPSDALDIILDACETKGLLDGSSVSRDLLDAKIMNIFTMMPSQVETKFFDLYKKNKRSAFTWYYDYMHHINYIRKNRILKNISFTTPSIYGHLDITINLSKPEKDPKSIILASKSVSSDYPKCLLCIENEGFAGHYKHDSRDQHRIIPLNLGNEIYYFQYSPYIYYQEHAIILSESHRPMKIDHKAFTNLLSLTDQCPGYFFGSNADLPIVGGSILSHDHYQGGFNTFPIENARTLKTWKKGDTKIAILHWPLSTIRLTSRYKDVLIEEAVHILDAWKNYSNHTLNIFNYTGDTSHQTITPVARKVKNSYQLDLLLRNNYTNDMYPLGMYHPHEDKWHIKKENIGLIEAMGLAILPSRLKDELNDVKDYLMHQKPLPERSLKHHLWAEKMRLMYQDQIQHIDTIIHYEIGQIFEGVLEDCGVFKQTSEGIKAFKSWIEASIL